MREISRALFHPCAALNAGGIVSGGKEGRIRLPHGNRRVHIDANHGSARAREFNAPYFQPERCRRGFRRLADSAQYIFP